MEIKINKEIRDYQEAVFMGLSLRQFLFALLAVAVAVGVYFGLQGVLGAETVSWLCVIAAFPFAILGFVKYHGMTAEQFIKVYIQSEFLMPKQLNRTSGSTAAASWTSSASKPPTHRVST